MDDGRTPEAAARQLVLAAERMHSAAWPRTPDGDRRVFFDADLAFNYLRPAIYRAPEDSTLRSAADIVLGYVAALAGSVANRQDGPLLPKSPEWWSADDIDVSTHGQLAAAREGLEAALRELKSVVDV